MNSRTNSERGFVLITAMFLIVVMTSMLGAYMILTRTELALAKSSKDSASGFNAAEAGLNIRASEVKEIFQNYNKPEGTAPANVNACSTSSSGTGDYACQTYTFGNSHSAVTYVTEEAGNPILTTVPPGEEFEGLAAQEYRYTVSSIGRNNQHSNEAILELTFKSRLVPLFQFALFFQDDLEFFNGAVMDLNGPVHTNSDLYLATQDGGDLNLEGQISVGGDLYRGMKSQSACSGYGGTVSVMNPTTYTDMAACSGNRTTVTNVSTWNDNIDITLEPVTVPEPEDLDAFSDGGYWMLADVRFVLRLTAGGVPDTAVSATGIEVVSNAGVSNSAATTALHSAGCTGLIQTNATGQLRPIGTEGPSTAGPDLTLYREYQHSSGTNATQRTLEVDLRALLECIYNNNSIIGGKNLNETSQGGLVFFFAIDGPSSASSHNNYSVRIRNAAQLKATTAAAPTPKGLTIATDQGLVVQGNYNSTNWLPAALISDSLWLLSTSWTDADSAETDVYDRDGLATIVQAAVLTGIARTGGANGTAGQDHGADTNGGGAINVFRFNEWFRCSGGGCPSSGIPDFTYLGSIVSLGPPRHSASSWGPFTYYSAPNRDWAYDERFNDPTQLPPMTPVFVQLKQELFVRDYQS